MKHTPFSGPGAISREPTWRPTVAGFPYAVGHSSAFDWLGATRHPKASGNCHRPFVGVGYVSDNCVDPKAPEGVGEETIGRFGCVSVTPLRPGQVPADLNLLRRARDRLEYCVTYDFPGLTVE